MNVDQPRDQRSRSLDPNIVQWWYYPEVLKMKRNVLLLITLLFGVLLFLTSARALNPYTASDTVDPGEMTGWPLLNYGTAESIDVKISSDIPVDIYIISLTDMYEDWYSWDIQEIRNRTSAADTFEGTTYEELSKEYSEDDAYAAIVYNPSETQTANVEIEYEFWEEVIEDEVEEAASEACCGGMLGLGILVILGVASTIFYLKRK
jgi:hypothetical protein